MARYIDATNLREEINSAINCQTNGEYNIYSDIIDMIDDQPTADVALVKHGHWRARMSTTTSVKCTCCNHYYEYETPFCPNCGADMWR